MLRARFFERAGDVTHGQRGGVPEPLDAPADDGAAVGTAAVVDLAHAPPHAVAAEEVAVRGGALALLVLARAAANSGDEVPVGDKIEDALVDLLQGHRRDEGVARQLGT